MLRARTKRVLTVAVVLAIAAAAYVLTTKEPSKLQRSASPSAEIGRSDTFANPPEQPISTTQKPDKSVGEPKLSSEDRAAETKRVMVAVLGPWREGSAKALIERGLAPADSERLAERFVDGVADCLLEAARKEYEAREKPEGDEIDWARTIAYLGFNRVQSAAVPCVANISQQAGIPLPADFGTAGSRDDITPEPPAPPWAADMEARIRDYVASYSAPEIETVFVQCLEKGCNVLLVGRDIRIFDLDFDVFAAHNGFKSALVGGDSKLRVVSLQR